MEFLGRREPTAPAATGFNFLVGGLGLSALTAATVLRLGTEPIGGPPPSSGLLVTFLALFVFARWMRFEIPPNITASLVVPIQLASILVLGPVPTAWLALPAFFTEVMRERPFRGLAGARLRAMLGIIAFNLGMEALVTLTAGATWHVLRPEGTQGILDSKPAALLALVATFVVFKGINEVLMTAGHWLRGVSVGEYLSGARTPVLIESVTLPLAALLVLMQEQREEAVFYLFLVSLALAAVVVRSLTRVRSELSRANIDLTRRVREIATLSEISRAISADIELDSLLDTIKQRCSDILPARHFYIALWAAGERDLRIALEVIDGIGKPTHAIPLGEGLTSHLIQSGRPLLVRDLVAERPELPVAPLLMDDRPNRSWLGAPMVARGEVVGAIVLQDPRADAYDENDLRVLLSIASQAAISVKNARLHQDALHALRVEAENRELKALNAKKSEFVNIVAHQFRTPLSTVIGYANLLLERARKTGEGEPIRHLHRHLETVHSESRRLAQMVEELLNLSRIRSGHLPLTMQTFDINRVLRETIAAHELLATERAQVIEADCGGEPASGGEPALDARGDSNFIRQALGNLIANAVKYGPEGGRILVASLRRGTQVLVEVVDEGPGVPAGDLERIFDEFYRAPGKTLDLPGTGLGLSICKGIIEAHGGSCWAESRGAGTAFCFALPGPAGRKTTRAEGPAPRAAGRLPARQRAGNPDAGGRDASGAGGAGAVDV